MNQRHDGSSNAPGPDPLAKLVRDAGPLPEASAEFRARLRAQLAEEWQRQVDAKRIRRRWIGAGIAAMLALAVAAVQVLDTNSAPAGRLLRAGSDLQLTLDAGEVKDAAVGTVIPAGSRLATGASPAALELAAGFNVRLAANTRLALHEASRLTLEEGRIYVDSGGVPGGISIDTPFGTVHDIGTQFSIAVQPERLAVQVRDGKVNVQRDAGVVAVTPGQRLLVDDTGVKTERVALSGGDWLWTESVAPVLEVRGRSVHAFLESIRRQTGLEIRYETPALAQRAAATVIGGQHPDLPPRELLDVVISATDFRHDVTETAILIHAD